MTDPTAPGATLSIKDLRVEFRRRQRVVRAVDGVSFSVEPGETVGLVGESGCGKTTVSLSVLGLLPRNGRITGGRIEVLGRDVAAMSRSQVRELRGSVASMVFQDPLTALNPTSKIGYQVCEPLVVHRGSSVREARTSAIEMLELVGLPTPGALFHRYPHELSGGMRQRVLIAMALVCRPALLIADEPTTALDVTIQAQILDLLARLKQELNMSLLIVTHDMGVIAGQADRVEVMYAGQIIEEGDVRSVFHAHQHRYTEALLASIPRAEEDGVELTSIPGRPPDLSQPIAGCRFAARCAHASELCRTDVPPEVRRDGHAFRCYHPVGSAVSQDKSARRP